MSNYRHKRGFILVKKNLPGYGPVLLPGWNSDREKMDKMKYEKEYLFTLADERNPRHHRKMFAIFRAVMDTNPGKIFPDEEAVLTWVKWHTGYVKPLEINGKTIFIVKSISFGEMGQERFEQFYKKALKLLAWFIGCTEIELESGAREYM